MIVEVVISHPRHSNFSRILVPGVGILSLFFCCFLSFPTACMEMADPGAEIMGTQLKLVLRYLQ